MDAQRRSTSGVPRPLVLRPLAAQDNNQDNSSINVEYFSRRSRTSSAGATINSSDNLNNLSSPKNLIEKYGFRILSPLAADMPHGSNGSGENDWSRSMTNFYEPDHLRRLAIVAVGEGATEEEDQCAFINRDYLAVWNPTVANNLLIAQKRQVEEVAFPGPKQHLDALLRCIWPSGPENWPLTIEQLKEALGPCCDWGVHPSIVSTISFYIHSNPLISIVEKLKLAARCGNTLLLSGSLRYQCRRETIFDIVNRSPHDYQQIVDGAYAAYVAGKMLEHAARDGDDDYKETVAESVRQEISKFKDQCRKLLDFSLPNDDEEPERSEKINSNESDVFLSQCCLVVSCIAAINAETPSTPTEAAGYYYVNRAYLSSWSPVFYSMFFGDFADRRRHRVSLELSDFGELRYWRLFLTLIHPSYMCSLWRLLPMEYCYSSTGRGVSTIHREWLDETFTTIFDNGNVDALMHVFRLAHKFQVLPLVDFCVLMIEAKSEMSLADKILLADTYHLPTLMAWCVGKLTTARSVKRMFSENDQLLASLSCNSHKILLERMLELV